jgi:hypothetical protein
MLFGREAERDGLWAEPLRRLRQWRHSSLARSRPAFTSANDLIFGVENVAAICLGVRLVIEALTVSMLFTTCAAPIRSLFAVRPFRWDSGQ